MGTTPSSWAPAGRFGSPPTRICYGTRYALTWANSGHRAAHPTAASHRCGPSRCLRLPAAGRPAVHLTGGRPVLQARAPANRSEAAIRPRLAWHQITFIYPALPARMRK